MSKRPAKPGAEQYLNETSLMVRYGSTKSFCRRQTETCHLIRLGTDCIPSGVLLILITDAAPVSAVRQLAKQRWRRHPRLGLPSPAWKENLGREVSTRQAPTRKRRRAFGFIGMTERWSSSGLTRCPEIIRRLS